MTTQAARAAFEPHYSQYWNWVQDVVVAYTPRARKLPFDYDQMLAGPGLCGSPAEVIDRVGQWQAAVPLPISRFAFMFDLGGMPTEEDPMVMADLGVFHDPLTFVSSDVYKAHHPRIARAVHWNMLAPLMDRVVRDHLVSDVPLEIEALAAARNAICAWAAGATSASAATAAAASRHDCVRARRERHEPCPSWVLTRFTECPLAHRE